MSNGRVQSGPAKSSNSGAATPPSSGASSPNKKQYDNQFNLYFPNMNSNSPNPNSPQKIPPISSINQLPSALHTRTGIKNFGQSLTDLSNNSISSLNQKFGIHSLSKPRSGKLNNNYPDPPAASAPSKLPVPSSIQNSSLATSKLPAPVPPNYNVTKNSIPYTQPISSKLPPISSVNISTPPKPANITSTSIPVSSLTNPSTPPPSSPASLAIPPSSSISQPSIDSGNSQDLESIKNQLKSPFTFNKAVDNLIMILPQQLTA